MSVVTVRIGDLAQARRALEDVRGTRTEVRLVTDRAVTAFAGAGFWRALEEELGRPLTVDCGDDAGFAMAALRAGCRDLLFEGPPEIAERLEGMAVAVGAVVRRRLDHP